MNGVIRSFAAASALVMLALATAFLIGATVAVVVALALLLGAAAVLLFAFQRVRGERKAREKAQILQRVANLEHDPRLSIEAATRAERITDRFRA